MGTAEDYDEVLKGKYPARAHAKKVADWMIAKGGDKTGTIYLEAQKAKLLEVGPFVERVQQAAQG
jgi:Xaa-Pro dipeptidase